MSHEVIAGDRREPGILDVSTEIASSLTLLAMTFKCEELLVTLQAVDIFLVCYSPTIVLTVYFL